MSDSLIPQSTQHVFGAVPLNSAVTTGAFRRTSAGLTNMPVVLTLYTRHNCSLCEDMLHTVNDFSQDLSFSIRVVDVDSDDQLRERYGDLVPVLKKGNEKICHHFFDRQALLQALEVEDPS